ncbi:MAG TPA: hypothetical protein VKU89_01625 [Solirubrobacteraceae bacterium]|nr:hypothetical protein [Solirubrobacteraceae bacterium]
MRALILALTWLFVTALAVLIVLAVLSEGITIGSLVLVVPSIFVLIVLGVGIGGALGRRPPDGR